MSPALADIIGARRERTAVMISSEYHGHFDLEQDEIDAYICLRLGPPA